MTATNQTPASGNPKPVTFDTLSAAQGLREIGFDHIQAEGIVTTISTAVSQTVATKTDLVLVHKDIDGLRKDVQKDIALARKDIDWLRKDVDGLRKDVDGLRKDVDELRKDVVGLRKDVDGLRKDVENDFKLVHKDLEASVNALRQEMALLHDKIIIKLGGLIVTMTFLLLAIGPFYFRWVSSLLN